MRLVELIQDLNTKLEGFKGVKYESFEQYRNTINAEIIPFLRETELGELWKISGDSIVLLTKEDIDVIGAGETMMKINVDVTRDKRMKHGDRGKINSISVILNPTLGYDLLDFQLLDIQKHFDRINLKRNIRYCKDYIEGLKKQILEYETQKNGFETELKNIENNG